MAVTTLDELVDRSTKSAIVLLSYHIPSINDWNYRVLNIRAGEVFEVFIFSLSNLKVTAKLQFDLVGIEFGMYFNFPNTVIEPENLKLLVDDFSSFEESVDSKLQDIFKKGE